MSPMAPVKAPKIDPADGMAAWATAGAFPFLNPFLTPGTAGGTTADAAKLAAAITPPTSSSATTLQDMLSIGRSTNPLDQMNEFAKTGLSSRASIAGQRHSAWAGIWVPKCIQACSSVRKATQRVARERGTKMYSSVLFGPLFDLLLGPLFGLLWFLLETSSIIHCS